MPLFSQKEILNLKLSSVPLVQLKELASNLRVDKNGSGTEIIKKLLSYPVSEKVN